METAMKIRGWVSRTTIKKYLKDPEPPQYRRTHERVGHKLSAEIQERRVRSIQYQMRIAKLPHHKDFATFDHGAATVTKAQIDPFCSGQFTKDAHNIILVAGTGTGKTHISIALGTSLVNQGKRVRSYNAVAAALTAIYTAVDADAAELALAEFEESDLAKRYPVITPSRRRAWNKVIPFLDYPPEVRRLIYTTNAIEALNSKIRHAVRTRGHFPSDDRAAKTI